MASEDGRAEPVGTSEREVGGGMTAIPERMKAVLLTGHGGLEKLEYREDVAVPVPRLGEVLISVSAAALNNTDINTRVGWYSKGVREATGEAGDSGFASADKKDAAWWGGSLRFPRIQGGDCCGRIVEVGQGVDQLRIGERVVVRPFMRSPNDPPFRSDGGGSFAEFMAVPSIEACRVDCDWSDVELASMPVAYSTAENMLHRAGVRAGERVLVTGASGGVGSAAVQLAKRRGAHVTGVTSASKADDVRALGADAVVHRERPLLAALAAEAVDVVVDVVAGPALAELLQVLTRGGRLAIAGAIGGPIVELDVRMIYLKDLTIIGCTHQDDVIFQNLIRYIERDEIRPTVARTYPLEKMIEAQSDFMAKKFTGKLVLVVSSENGG
jgi:NADPH:quinone reductase-like Zn-dependent oxidoreductase